MLKLDSVEKRIGIVLILFGLILLIFFVLAWAFNSSQFISYHMPDGNVVYYKRGSREASLAQLLQLILIVFPILFCGLALMLGYGKRLFNWIKNGSPQEKEDNEDDAKNS